MDSEMAQETPASLEARGAAHSGLSLREIIIRYGFLLLLVGLIVFFSLATRGFASPQAAVFILQSVSITGILALGVTATLVVGGFDLSIGSIATSAMMAAA